MSSSKNSNESQTQNQPNKELTESLRNIKIFTDKMLLSTSTKNKEIFLWSENTGTVAFSYLDENLRTFIPYGKIKVIDPKIYSEYFIYHQENKSLFNIWNTANSQYYSKFSCTDEKISSFTISEDGQILYVGTVNGNIISYNLQLGNILRNFNITKNEILNIAQVEDYVIILTKEKLLLYKFCSFLCNEISSQVPREIYSYNFSNMNNDNELNYQNFYIENNSYIYLWNNNNIIMLDIEGLKPIKKFNIIAENDDYKNKAFIDKLIVYDSKIFFSNGNKEIFSFDSKNYSIDNTHEIKINKNYSMLYLPNTIKFALNNITVFVLGTKNNIITGHEDGKICIWKQKTNKDLFYTYEKMFQFHKGMITNIVLLNKPISQYGLNFNKQISECIVSKVQNKQMDNVILKQNNFEQNNLANFIEKNIENNMEDVLCSIYDNLLNNKNKRKKEEEENEDKMIVENVEKNKSSDKKKNNKKRKKK